MEFWRAVLCPEAQENPLDSAGKNFETKRSIANNRLNKFKLGLLKISVTLANTHKFYDHSR